MASEGNTPSVESNGIHSFNPTVISEEAKKSFAKFGINIGKLIKKGKYGAVYEGKFGDQFSADKFKNEFKCVSLHMKKVGEPKHRFSLKYMDIPLRKQLGVTDETEAVDRELKALMIVQNNGIVDFFFAVQLSKTNQWFLFLELADGNLQTFLTYRRKSKQTLSHELSKTWIKKLTESLKYLHQNGISHGLIKPSNILFFYRDKDKEQIDVKIADFVSSHVMTEQQMKNLTKEEKQLVDYRMDEDLTDIYFLFQEILNLNQFKSEDMKKTAHDSIKCLITSEGNSVQCLDSLLKSKYFS